MLVYAPGSYHIGDGPSNAGVYIISFEAVSDILPSLYNRIIDLNSEQRGMLSDLISNGTNMFERVDPESGMIGMRKKDGVNDYELQKLRNKLELLLIDIWRSEHQDICDTRAANHANLEREQFNTIVEYLRANLQNPLTLEEIAASSHISVSKLSAIFRQQSGRGTIAYFNDMKIAEAKRLIRETSMNFTQIAESLGFCTVHYFSKLFKRITGITPSEYARSVNSD